MPRRTARGKAIAVALRDFCRQIPATEVGGRFVPYAPRNRVAVYAEVGEPRVYFAPLGETVERVRKTLTRRVQVSATFAAPVTAAWSRDDWIGLVEAYLERLELVRMAGHPFEGYDVVAQWDPSAAQSSRFAGAYTLEYSALRVG